MSVGGDRMPVIERTAVEMQVALLPNGKPVLKWAGGKTQLLKEIFSRLPGTFGRYHEPFVGSGAVFFALAPEKATLSDRNANLISLYTDIRDSADSLWEAFNQLETEFNRLRKDSTRANHFYSCRKEFNSSKTPSIRRSALMVYLNKAGFNGIYRENSLGHFNVPFGKKESISLPSREHLYACREALAQSELLHGDFETVVDRASAGDFVYLDPPYVPLSASSSFTSYQAEGFTLEDQTRLAEIVKTLDDKRVFFLLSNSDTEIVRELYRPFTVDTVLARRNLNSKADGRGKVPEVLVRNY